MESGKEYLLERIIKNIITNKIELSQVIVKYLAIFISFYHLYNIVGGRIEPFFHRFTHLSLALFLGYLLLSLKKDGINKLFSIALGIVVLLLYLYFIFNYERIIILVPGLNKLTNWDKIIAILFIILVFDCTRRYIGWILPTISMIFLTYIFVGPYLTGILHYKGLSLTYVIHYLTFTFEGIFGSAIAVSSSYIILFLIFGNFLNITGVGDYFIKLATALAGGSRGGSAKIAVLASALIGTIMGAPTANVVITGTFTIPLMKKKGFEPDFSAGVEAAASTGGMILPPIMGSTAFIMAQILGITYFQVARAAMIPAIIYYSAILIMVDLYAAKKNLLGLPKHERPPLIVILKDSYKLLPLIVIIILLLRGYSPDFAGIVALIITILLGIIKPLDRLSFEKAMEGLEKAPITAIQLIMACAVSGIIMAAISLTGLSGKITYILLQSMGSLKLLILLFIMISALILGMGLAVTPTYLLCAVLGVPVLTSLGFIPLAAHLFILYYAVLAPLTPPFAITSYTAANIAGGQFGKTAIQALFLTSSGFIIPFMFIYNNELLMIGKGIDIFIILAKLMIAVICLSVGIQGFLFKNLKIYERIIIFISGILLVNPGLFGDIIGLYMLVYFYFQQKTNKVNSEIKILLKGE